MLPLSVPVKPYCSWSCWLKVMKIRWDLMWFSICAGRNHCNVFYLDIKSSSKRWISECTCVLQALCNFWLCMIQKLWPWSQEGVASVPSPVVLEILIIQLDNQDSGTEWTFPKGDMFNMIQNRQTWSKCASVFLSWTCMCCCLAGWTMWWCVRSALGAEPGRSVNTARIPCSVFDVWRHFHQAGSHLWSWLLCRDHWRNFCCYRKGPELVH